MPEPPLLAAPTATDDAEWPGILEALRRLPQNPRKVTGPHNWMNGLQLFVDYLATVPPRMQRWTGRLRQYGPDFRKVAFRTRDDVALSAWLGLAPAGTAAPRGEPRDGLLLIPGLYTSKDNARIRARCERILRRWGYHVLALDLRGVGESQRVYTTPGWKEAQDIADAVAYFRRHANLRRLHLYTESVAATSAILAAAQEAAEGRRLLDGRIISMSPYADAHRIVDLYSTRNPAKTALGQDFVAVQMFFNALLRLQGYKGGRFDAYARDGARHYGVSTQRFLDLSSPGAHVARVNTPLLVVHSTDDGLVPVSEAHALQKAAAGNPNVHVWILPWGYHCLYEMADPDWYWSVLARVYGAGPSGPGPNGQASAR